MAIQTPRVIMSAFKLLFFDMNLFAIRHSKTAYMADFVFYGVTIMVLTLIVILGKSTLSSIKVGLIVLLGLLSWTLIEYVLHRFVLHHLAPFNHWHSAHHQQPKALICAPTIVSASLIAVLVFLPTILIAGLQIADAYTLGVLIGYLFYAVTHHAIHHWHTKNKWLKQRKYWHARHHYNTQIPNYGVTTTFWDYLFSTY
jgi:sterol desaturase/sphingolipid hydroxylase (fatty acid hydroxylase superfamily)